MADYPRKSSAARYIDRDGVPIPVDLDGNEIPDEGHNQVTVAPVDVPTEEPIEMPEADPTHETKRGSK